MIAVGMVLVVALLVVAWILIEMDFAKWEDWSMVGIMMMKLICVSVLTMFALVAVTH